MRSRSFLLIVLASVPAVATAQGGVRLPRGGTSRPGTGPAALPPEIPAVSRALEFRRSRWSGEGYSMFSAIQVPAGDGGSTSYTTVGAGTRADYRFAENFSATIDLTASFLGSFANSQTAEIGTRFVPSPRSQNMRPFFDIRAAYTHVNDRYDLPNEDSRVPGTLPNAEFSQRGRYTGGLGAVGGAGFEYSITNSLAFTNELTAMRTHMTSRQLTSGSNNPGDTRYWMTSIRYTLGLKYNAVEALHLVQKAMP